MLSIIKNYKQFIKVDFMYKLIPIILIVLFIPSVMALQYRNVCNDNQTLNKFMNFTACENVTCIDYNFTQNVNCEYGCDTTTNSCNQSPIYQYLTVGIILLVITIIIIIIVKVSSR
jgi:hypothetical protein